MNFQNLPRTDKTIKAAFVPKLDTFLFCDYKAIEMRLLAYYMAAVGDPSMARVIAAGEDLHTASAIGALRLNREPTDEERQVGKTLNFSIVYGGGAPTLIRQLGITYPEAKQILDDYHAQWPGIKLVQQVIQDRIQERGYITTLFGRHLHPESDHKALNALIQGCAADLMKSALVRIDEYLLDSEMRSHMVCVIHDEVILDCADEEVPTLVEVLPYLMGNDIIEEHVPVEIDVEVSNTTWAEKVAYVAQ